MFRFYEDRSKSRFVTFCDFRYESGDHVAVFPTNDSTLVNKLGQILGVDLDMVISLNNLDGMALKAQSTLTLLARPSKTKTALDIWACSTIACYCCKVLT